MLHGLWYWSTLFYQQPVRVGEARTYRGQHRYGGDLGGTLGFPVKLGLHTIPTLDPLMNHIPSGRLAPPTGLRYSSEIVQSSIGALCVTTAFCLFAFVDELLEFIEFSWLDVLKRDTECALFDPLHARVFN